MATRQLPEHLKGKHLHIVVQYSKEKEREYFNSYILGAIGSIVTEETYSDKAKVKGVLEVLELVDFLKNKEG